MKRGFGMILSKREYDALATVWEYLRLAREPAKADCIIGFGNYNTDIAVRAAELYHAGYAPIIVFTGGLGRNTLGMLSRSEAECFAETALKCGVPAENILTETKSTNTAENLNFTRSLLNERGFSVKTALGVHQPFMERRIWAAAAVVWPELKLTVTSPQTDYETFIAHAVRDGVTERAVIEEVVGDLQRMELYAERGWQLPQQVPHAVKAAYGILTAAGYGGQLA